MGELAKLIKKNKEVLRQLTSLNNEIKELKDRVKTLEQKDSYYLTKEEIESIEIGGTD
ncbi:MAG: hypothetical protein U9O91_06810 [Candidatus Caldatribacteriota bacterium]|nr:hypothetical protein [Candidatus Caldatribacteriota bacterium]